MGSLSLPRTTGEATLFPQLDLVPHAEGSLVGQLLAELVCEHNQLAAVMRFVRKHVAEHARAGGQCGSPTHVPHTAFERCRPCAGSCTLHPLGHFNNKLHQIRERGRK